MEPVVIPHTSKKHAPHQCTTTLVMGMSRPCTQQCYHIMSMRTRPMPQSRSVKPTETMHLPMRSFNHPMAPASDISATHFSSTYAIHSIACLTSTLRLGIVPRKVPHLVTIPAHNILAPPARILIDSMLRNHVRVAQCASQE